MNEFELLAAEMDEIIRSDWEDPRVMRLQAKITALWRRRQVAYPSAPSLWPNWKGIAGASDQVKQAAFGVLVRQAQADVRAAGHLVRAVDDSRGPKIEA